MAIPEEDMTVVDEPAANGAPKWRDDPIAREKLEVLRDRFEAGDRLAFRVRLPVRRKRGRTTLSHFDVVLEKDDALRRGEHHFIRRGITIPEVRSPREGPIRALLIADDEPISTFLGDAENPAHSDWSERNDRIRTRYENGASTLRYVKNAIAQLAKGLSIPPAGRVPDLLAGIFSIDVAGSGAAHGAGDDEKPGDRGGIDATRITARPHESPLRIVRVANGFTILGNGAPGGTTWRAEVAYRTRGGDPFRKYSPYDFAIGRGGVRFASDGAEIRAARDNHIEFLPARNDFHLTVTGFDPRRDLVVRVIGRDDDAPEAELH
jgi:hypothetical protein